MSDNPWFNQQPVSYRIAWYKDALEKASLQDPPPKDMKQAVEELQRLIYMQKNGIA